MFLFNVKCFRVLCLRVNGGFFISSHEFLRDPHSCVEKVMTMSRGDRNSFIGKPIYGQESIDFYLFDEYTRPNHVHKYLERISALYKGCVFQPFIKSLM